MCATTIPMSGKVWPIWGTDGTIAETTYEESAGQKYISVM